MGEIDRPRVRLAEDGDLAWLAAHDLDERVLRLKLDAQELMVAEVGGELAGLIRLDHLWSSIPFVAQARVVEAARRRGVGRALVDATAEHERRRGATVLLSSTDADHTDSHVWHRAVGFEECGYIAGLNPGGIGEILYRRIL